MTSRLQERFRGRLLLKSLFRIVRLSSSFSILFAQQLILGQCVPSRLAIFNQFPLDLRARGQRLDSRILPLFSSPLGWLRLIIVITTSHLQQ